MLSCDEVINLYWNQYISIEKEFAETVNYVALAEDNYRTYSDAYIKIMLQLGSEVDIALKLYCQILDKQFSGEKFYRFSDYLGTTSQMSELLGISSISGILRFGRYPAYHGISEPHLALKSSKTVVETAAYYYAASLSIAAFAEA